MPAIDIWKAVLVHFLLKGSKDGNMQTVILYSKENARITIILIYITWKVLRSRSFKKGHI